MKVDKENENVNYNDEEHIYWDKKDNEKYISVTTLIEKFVQPFDSEFFSKYKALEKIIPANIFKMKKGGLLATKKIDNDFLKSVDITPEQLEVETQNILNEWSRINKESCERGTKIHAEIENSFYEGDFSIVKDLPLSKEFVCKKNYFDLSNVEKGVFPELMIDYKDGVFRIAGQSDLVIKYGNEIWIKDWKTNKKLDDKSYFNSKTKKYSSMLYPLNGLMDCNLVHYQIQLSTYAWMLKQKHPEFIIKGLEIIHFDHDGNINRYDLEYIPEQVENMIKFYKRELEHQEFLRKNAPVR
jgi:ATP-dependent exoDNAse (exonuclease V) beta subunit